MHEAENVRVGSRLFWTIAASTYVLGIPIEECETNLRRQSKVRPVEFGERDSEIYFAEPRSPLKNAECPANFQPERFSHAPPLRLIHQHCIQTESQCKLDRLAFSQIQFIESGSQYAWGAANLDP